MFLQVSVCPQGGGVCLSACWDAIPLHDQADTPQDQADHLGPGRHTLDQADTPQTRQTPWDQADPLGPGRHPPDQADTPWTRQTPQEVHTVYKRPVCILLECILVTPVCHSVHRGGEYQGRYTPGPGTSPGTRYTPQDQVHPPGPGTPPTREIWATSGGTHPTGMHSCLHVLLTWKVHAAEV